MAILAPFIASPHYRFSLVKYEPYQPDYLNSNYVSPLEEQFELLDGKQVMLRWNKWHFLGTNKLGEDVASGLIHGARVSMAVGFFSMLIALAIGLAAGLISGYFSDSGLKFKLVEYIMFLPGILLAVFYGFVVRANKLKESLQESTLSFVFAFAISLVISLIIVALFYSVGRLLSKINLFSKPYKFPVDNIIMRIVEITTALPSMILILAFASVAKPSIFNLVLIIGFISWTDVARIVRAETLKTKQLDFIQAAKAIGYNKRKIIFRHIMPNIFNSISSVSLVIFATAVLSESSLSFLGIGMPYQVVTWGSLLASAREEISAWWLIVFPGLMLTVTLISLNVLKNEVASR